MSKKQGLRRVKQSKEAKVVGADTTHIKVKGKDVVVGIVVEADNGMVIDIEVLEDETSQTIKSQYTATVSLI